MDELVQSVLLTLEEAFDEFVSPAAPPRLAAAMRHAVFAGGKRLRAQLVMRVAAAHGPGDAPGAAAAAAAALELLHCASLVHDDLPCFDDAATRRGEPTVHRMFGQPIAVLAGDALIVLAFEVVAHAMANSPRSSEVVGILARSVGANGGLAAGQAAELDPMVDWRAYHRAKTGSLFEAAVQLGATVGDGSIERWTAVGSALGSAYQLADDIVDLIGAAEQLGKPTRQDSRCARPNGAATLGLPAAFEQLKQLLSVAIAAVPPCPGAEQLRAWMVRTAADLYAAHHGPELAQAIRSGADAR